MKHKLSRGLVALILVSIILAGCLDPISALTTAATPRATSAIGVPTVAPHAPNKTAAPSQPTAAPGQPTAIPTPAV